MIGYKILLLCVYSIKNENVIEYRRYVFAMTKVNLFLEFSIVTTTTDGDRVITDGWFGPRTVK